MLCENLKNLRQAAGMTQSELAERLHVVRQTVSKWENGSSVPDADMLSLLAEIFAVPMEVLLAEGGVSPRTDQTDRSTEKRQRRRIVKLVAGVLIAAGVVIALAAILLLAANWLPPSDGAWTADLEVQGWGEPVEES